MCIQSKLLNYISKNKIDLINYEIPFAKGAAMRDHQSGSYAIFYNETQISTNAELNEVLAHEAGHCATGALHNVASKWDIVEKHEEKANRWAIETCIPFAKLQTAMCNGCAESYQLAEKFDMPESFIQKAICYYTQACGLEL